MLYFNHKGGVEMKRKTKKKKPCGLEAYLAFLATIDTVFVILTFIHTFIL